MRSAGLMPQIISNARKAPQTEWLDLLCQWRRLPDRPTAVIAYEADRAARFLRGSGAGAGRAARFVDFIFSRHECDHGWYAPDDDGDSYDANRGCCGGNGE